MGTDTLTPEELADLTPIAALALDLNRKNNPDTHVTAWLVTSTEAKERMIQDLLNWFRQETHLKDATREEIEQYTEVLRLDPVFHTFQRNEAALKAARNDGNPNAFFWPTK